jgi:hypothetical protein
MREAVRDAFADVLGGAAEVDRLERIDNRYRPDLWG